jgi:hypothetical protein
MKKKKVLISTKKKVCWLARPSDDDNRTNENNFQKYIKAKQTLEITKIAYYGEKYYNMPSHS